MAKPTFISHVKEIKKELRKRQVKALHKAGVLVQSAVVKNINILRLVDTGRMKGSYGFKLEPRVPKVSVGTNLDYALWWEFGTGIHAEGGKGRTTPWSYKTSKGNWVTTSGHPAKPHLRPAFTDNLKKIQAVIMQEMAG